MNTEIQSALSHPDTMDERKPLEQAKSVEITRVRKAYGLRPVLRDVSFDVLAGQCVAVLGPNGAGKTTLLRVLATLTRPVQGSVAISGYDALRDAQIVRRLVGYVGHTPLLYDELTARENLLFFARMYSVPQAESRVDMLLERVGMGSRANDRVGTFSRGQAQRVSLARGILHDPQVLLLDEPDTGLDEDALTLLHKLISERQAVGATTLLTTHTLERGLLWSDMVVVLTNGRVSHSGASGEVTVPELRKLYSTAGRSRQ
jgi:heme ABC exporter ATP-binding subunit CcmA